MKNQTIAVVLTAVEHIAISRSLFAYTNMFICMKVYLYSFINFQSYNSVMPIIRVM